MERLALAFFGVACFVGGLVSVLLMLYYFVFMLGSVRPGRKRYAKFLGPLVFVFPQLFDDAGNKARIKTLLFAALFAVSFGGLNLFHHLSDQLSEKDTTSVQH